MRYGLLCISLNHINMQFIKNALKGVHVYLFVYCLPFIRRGNEEKKQEIIYLMQ